jgi:hypothetical protein
VCAQVYTYMRACILQVLKEMLQTMHSDDVFQRVQQLSGQVIIRIYTYKYTYTYTYTYTH